MSERRAYEAIGIDGCKGGWFLFKFDRSGWLSFDVAATFRDAVSAASCTDRVLVDILIGLPSFLRHADVEHAFGPLEPGQVRLRAVVLALVPLEPDQVDAAVVREAAQRFRDELDQLTRTQSTYLGAGLMFLFIFGVAHTFQAQRLFAGYPAWQLYVLLAALGASAVSTGSASPRPAWHGSAAWPARRAVIR